MDKATFPPMRPRKMSPCRRAFERMPGGGIGRRLDGLGDWFPALEGSYPRQVPKVCQASALTMARNALSSSEVNAFNCVGRRSLGGDRLVVILSPLQVNAPPHTQVWRCEC